MSLMVMTALALLTFMARAKVLNPQHRNPQNRNHQASYGVECHNFFEVGRLFQWFPTTRGLAFMLSYCTDTLSLDFFVEWARFSFPE